MWKIIYTKQAIDDALKITPAGLKPRVQKLINILENNPLQSPPKFEKLKGDLIGAYSRRINIKHRLVYQVLDNEHIVKIIRMWSHYD